MFLLNQYAKSLRTKETETFQTTTEYVYICFNIFLIILRWTINVDRGYIWIQFPDIIIYFKLLYKYDQVEW